MAQEGLKFKTSAGETEVAMVLPVPDLQLL